MEMPFDEGILELFKGVGGPMVPGIHGVVCMPNPGNDVVETITKIRDMCDDLLNRMDKDDQEKENNDEFQGRSEERKSESKEQDEQEQEQKERL